MSDLVSIILPVYNGEKYIYGTIESILKQTYKNFELLIVNDGSTDNTLNICSEISQKDSRLKIINKKNGGVSSARNVGLQQVSGEYIVFIDSDDFVAEDFLECLYNDIEISKSDISICGFNHLYMEEYNKIGDKNNGYDKSEFEVLYEPINLYYKNQEIPLVWNKLYRKSVIGDIIFDESVGYAEDFLFTAMVLLNANKVTIRKNIKYYYINRSDSLSYNEGNLKVWQGYVLSKKYIYDRFVELDFSDYLRKCAWNEYCKAIMALYRYVVHKRLEEEWRDLDKIYREMLFVYLSNSSIGVMKKLEYLSFVYSYFLACVFHKSR